jgi:hypothetical protein
LAICAAVLIIAIVGCERADRSTADAVALPRAVVSTAARAQNRQTAECLISTDGIGPIRLGRTMTEARRAMPGAKFERTSDGDGAALVEVSFGTDTSVTISADEDDPEAPINWSKPVIAIETFSPTCHTVGGVRPSSLVVDVEKVFGPVKQIVKSEIESREYITFERQPAALTLRLDYTGEFPEGSRQTQRFSAGAKIYSIVVSSFGTR